MDVFRIDSLAEFDAHRAPWEALERADRHATVFTSWRWLRAYFPVTRLRWSVIGLRDGDRPVAYLPLARGGTIFDRELFLGGNPRADYAGMLIDPEYETAALNRFGDELGRHAWDAFNIMDARDPRFATVVDRLVAHGCRIVHTGSTRCLSVTLPPTWDDYLRFCVSSKTRVNTVRVERRLAEALPAFRISEPAESDIDDHIDAAVLLNHRRWGGNLASARRRYGRLFRNAYDQDVLRLFVYWDGATPVAAAAAFVDDVQRSFGLYMIGFDQAYAKLSPGKGIVGRAIRAAIEGNYARFDFLRGDEPFKQQYASEVHETQHYRLTAPGLRARAVHHARPAFLAAKLAVANLVYGPGRTL